MKEILSKIKSSFIQYPGDEYFVYAIAFIATAGIAAYLIKKRIDYNYKKETEKED